MKKLAFIFALLLVPCSAFGLEMLPDSALDDLTGQAGVSIAADDIQLFLNVERFAWIDCDGYGTSSAYGGDCDSTIGGAIYLDNFQMDTININQLGARGDSLASATGESNQSLDGSTPAMAGSSCGVIDLFYDYGDDSTGACLLSSTLADSGSTLGLNNYTNINPWTTASGFLTKSITIDATAALPLHTAGWITNKAGLNLPDPGGAILFQPIGGVIIGLPTMEIYIHSMAVTPRVTSQVTSNPIAIQNACYNDGESYGTFEMQGITFSALSGWVEIAPTGRPGDGL